MKNQKLSDIFLSLEVYIYLLQNRNIYFTLYSRSLIVQNIDKIILFRIFQLIISNFLKAQALTNIDAFPIQMQQEVIELIRDRIVPVQTVIEQIVQIHNQIETILENVIQVQRVIEIEKIRQKVVVIYDKNEPSEEGVNKVIVQVPTYIEKLITVERVVEKIIEVEQEVQKMVQVRIEKPFLVQIEKIVQKQVPKGKKYRQIIVDRQKIVPIQFSIGKPIQVSTLIQKTVQTVIQVPKVIQVQVVVQKVVTIPEPKANAVKEIIQEVPVFIQKIITVEVAVQKIIEVPVIKEKVVQIIMEVPKVFEIEKIIEVVVEV